MDCAGRDFFNQRLVFNPTRILAHTFWYNIPFGFGSHVDVTADLQVWIAVDTPERDPMHRALEDATKG